MSAPRMTPGMKVRLGARLLLLQARWDPARLQGPGFAFALDPWLQVCWGGDPSELLAARRRHLEHFNTHPIAAWLTAGIVCRQEAAASSLLGAAREAEIRKIGPLKMRLGAALAALYDSFFWGALRPASALAGILAAQAAYLLGSPHALSWAVAAALSVYNVPAVMARIFGLWRGWADGERAAAELTKLSVQTWIRGLRWATMGGAFVAFGIGAWPLSGGDRLIAVLTFAAGLILTRRGVSPLAQLGLAGVGGMAVSAAGLRL